MLPAQEPVAVSNPYYNDVSKLQYWPDADVGQLLPHPPTAVSEESEGEGKEMSFVSQLLRLMTAGVAIQATRRRLGATCFPTSFKPNMATTPSGRALSGKGVHRRLSPSDILQRQHPAPRSDRQPSLSASVRLSCRLSQPWSTPGPTRFGRLRCRTSADTGGATRWLATSGRQRTRPSAAGTSRRSSKPIRSPPAGCTPSHGRPRRATRLECVHALLEHRRRRPRGCLAGQVALPRSPLSARRRSCSTAPTRASVASPVASVDASLRSAGAMAGFRTIACSAVMARRTRRQAVVGLVTGRRTRRGARRFERCVRRAGVSTSRFERRTWDGGARPSDCKDS